MRYICLLLTLVIGFGISPAAQRGRSGEPPAPRGSAGQPRGKAAPAPAPAPAPAIPGFEKLFANMAIGSIHLEFTAADYAGLTPKSSGGFFGLFGGGGGSQSWLQGAEGKRNGYAASRGVEFAYVHATVTIDGKTVKNVGVRYKGNGTYFSGAQADKISLKIDFGEYVDGQRFGTLRKLNLHNNITDATWMNEPLAFRLHREAGVPSPRTSFARVFITVPGRYDRKFAGLFSIVENPDESFVTERGLPEAGAIFKPVTERLFADLGPAWKSYNQSYDPKTKLTPAQQQRMIDLCRLVSKGSDAEFAARIGEFIDLDNFARYFAVTVFLSDLDGLLGPGQNFYLYLDPRTQKLTFIPWDQDHSFGQFFRGSQSSREQLSIEHPWTETSPFLERMLKLAPFRAAYLARLNEFSKTLFVPDRFHRQVDELTPVLRPAVQQESAERLRRFDAAVAGQVPPGNAGDFRGANIPIKPFVKARAQSIADQLAGRSAGQRIRGRG